MVSLRHDDFTSPNARRRFSPCLFLMGEILVSCHNPGTHTSLFQICLKRAALSSSASLRKNDSSLAAPRSRSLAQRMSSSSRPGSTGTRFPERHKATEPDGTPELLSSFGKALAPP